MAAESSSANLEKISKEAVHGIDSNISNVVVSLQKISPLSDEVCQQSSLRRFNDLVFETPQIRWLGIYRDNQKVCETNRRNWSFDMEKVSPRFYLDKGIFLSKVDGSEGDTDLFIALERSDYVLLADIEPISTSIHGCFDCLEYKLTLNTKPELIFMSDNKVKDSSKSYVYSDLSSHYVAKLEIKTERELAKQYNSAVILLRSLGITLLLMLACWYFSSKRIYFSWRIKRGIANNEFIPYYQPIVNLNTNSLFGVEILMRWSGKRLSSPRDFMDFAERTGVIIEMTEQMLQHVAQDIINYRWDRSPIIFSINIVPEHLHEDLLLHQLLDLCENYHLNMSQFAVELTERVPIHDLAQAAIALTKLKVLGVKIEVDDTGVGYGGFSYVQQLPIDIVKVDKMFIDQLGSNPSKTNGVLDSIIELSRRTNTILIAEGVETKEQLSYLRERDIYLIQGYLFSKPLPADQFDNWQKVYLKNKATS